MSGEGRPAAVGQLDTAGVRVAVVATRWYPEVTDALLAGALRALADLGIDDPRVLRVPGAFELPVAAKVLADSGYDAVVALGLVVRGGTPHFEYVCQGVTAGCTEVSVSTGVPVGFGVLTCDTIEQAIERSGLPGSKEDKGREAAEAAVEMAVLLRGLRPAHERQHAHH